MVYRKILVLSLTSFFSVMRLNRKYGRKPITPVILPTIPAITSNSSILPGCYHFKRRNDSRTLQLFV